MGERGSAGVGEVRERKEWEKDDAGGFGGVGSGREVERGVELKGNVEEAEAAFFRCCCWSCMKVLTTQIGFVAAAVATPAEFWHQTENSGRTIERENEDEPAVAAEIKCTAVFSFPLFSHCA